MTLENQSTLEIGAGLTALVAAGALVAWLVARRRPTADELERTRRRFLVQSGRLVDGMLLDIAEVEAKDGRTLTLLIFSYRIAGVDYECSQDITGMTDIVSAAQSRVGFPCTVRYQPGNPQNSIIVAENWTGLHVNKSRLPAHEDPGPIDTSSLRGSHS